MKKNDAICDIIGEFERAGGLHPAFNSQMEGWAVIQAKLDDLRDEVKLHPKLPAGHRTKHKVTEVAAMALKYMIDLIE